ncbi:MAG: site-specific integrase [Bacteroidia bacterium]|nr:site-specific integrase [Bacteroidia bacterium]
MGISLRKKYFGKGKGKKRAYKFQLDIYQKGRRERRIFHNLVVYPYDSVQLRNAKHKRANQMKSKIELEFHGSKNGFTSILRGKSNFIDYFKGLRDKKNEANKRVWNNAINYFIEFGGAYISFEEIGQDFLEKFKEFLKVNISNNSASIYFSKLAAALAEAKREKIISENPADGIKRIGIEKKVMVYLLEEEVQALINTDIKNVEVKKAFLFACNTGLRVSDILALRWTNIKNGKVHFKQKKTKQQEYFHLSKDALKIIGEAKDDEEYVFNISMSEKNINTSIRTWAKKAKIHKHISMHTGRHTFATMLVTKGVNIYTVKELLGHKNIESTLIYAKVIGAEKEKAINSLPSFNFTNFKK